MFTFCPNSGTMIIHMQICFCYNAITDSKMWSIIVCDIQQQPDLTALWRMWLWMNACLTWTRSWHCPRWPRSPLCVRVTFQNHLAFFLYYSVKRVNIKFVRCFCVIHKVDAPNLPPPNGPTLRLLDNYKIKKKQVTYFTSFLFSSISICHLRLSLIIFTLHLLIF